MGLAIFFIVLVLIVGVAILANKAKMNRLRSAPYGDTQIESLKANRVTSTVRQYQRAGYTIVNQNSAKSFGSKTRVTITFRKVVAPATTKAL